MKYLFLSLVMLLTFSVNGQKAEAVIFSEAGETFTLYLNGVKVNEEPSNNVVATELDGEFYQARIDFQDKSLADFSANMVVKFGIRATYRVKLNRKGEYKLRYYSETPMSASAVNETEPAVQPTRTSAPIEVVEEESVVPESYMNRENTTTTTSTTTITQQNTKQSKGDGMGVKVRVNDMEMEVDMDLKGMEMEAPGMDVDMNVEGMDRDISAQETIQTTTVTRTVTTNHEIPEEEVVQEVMEEGNCQSPVSEMNFKDFESNLKSKSFSDSQVTMAKQFTRGNCLTSEQVKRIMKVFTFEEDRLDFAKFAYDYTFDQNNYYKVNEAFEFELSIEELDEYLESK